jgi:hypothetical protein
MLNLLTTLPITVCLAMNIAMENSYLFHLLFLRIKLFRFLKPNNKISKYLTYLKLFLENLLDSLYHIILCGFFYGLSQVESEVDQYGILLI